MSEVGVVQWRNVGDALTPLKMDGLEPRFLNLNPGAIAPRYAARLEPPDAGASVLSSLRLCGESYLGKRDPSSPEFSPLFASLEGLPPLLVQAGSLEGLVDQIRAFVARARTAGNTVTYSEYPDMVHVWHLFRAVTPAGTRAIEEVGAFIRAHTTTGSRSAP